MFKLVGMALGGALVVYGFSHIVTQPDVQELAHEVQTVTDAGIEQLKEEVSEMSKGLNLDQIQKKVNSESAQGISQRVPEKESLDLVFKDSSSYEKYDDESLIKTGVNLAEISGSDDSAGQKFWHVFWTPFSSKAAAQGFAENISKLTGLEVHEQAGSEFGYRVALSYEDEAELQNKLVLIQQLTGLDVR